MTRGRMRTVYEAMQMAWVAHARWEIWVSDNILRNSKRRALLLLMLMPIVPIGVALGADLPRIVGGKEAYAPAFYTPLIFVVSIVIGLCAGLITGCIGAGGGFIITPALMSVGVKGILAVGTDLFHIFAKAIMGTAVHRKLGNVSVKLAVAFLVGSGIGATAGGLVNRTLYEQNPVLSDTFINVVYVVLLGFLGTYAAVDFLRLRKGPGAVGAHPGRARTASWRVPRRKVSLPSCSRRGFRRSLRLTRTSCREARRSPASSSPSAARLSGWPLPSWASAGDS